MKPLELVAVLLCVTVAHSYSTRTPETSRRSFFAVPFVVIAGAPAISKALDIDAFMEKELESGTCNEKTDKRCQPKLSEDEALCRFGQPAKETGEACVRAGMSTTKPSGVDAFGKIDRGDYARCKPYYEWDEKNKPIKKWRCQ
jgi:hypothetical protein